MFQEKVKGGSAGPPAPRQERDRHVGEPPGPGPLPRPCLTSPDLGDGPRSEESTAKAANAIVPAHWHHIRAGPAARAEQSERKK